MTEQEQEYEQRRLEEVERYGIMDTPWDETYDGYTRLAATLFGVPFCVVSIVDKDRIWIKAGHGMEGGSQLSREPGLCDRTVLTTGPHIVNDLSLQDATRRHSLTLGDNGIRFYAGIPLVTRSGYGLGAFCIMDRQPRRLSRAKLDHLSALGKLLMDYIELMQLQKETLQQQKAMIKALAHDLKNPLTIISLEAELLQAEDGVTENIAEMSRQIAVAGRKINETINKRLSS